MRAEFFWWKSCFSRSVALGQGNGAYHGAGGGREGRAAIFWTRLCQDREGRVGSEEVSWSGAVHGERSGTKQLLEGPARGEVNADTASGLAYACANFEQLRAQGFDLCRTPGQR